jgi:ornithine--oxo-acid transaminase
LGRYFVNRLHELQSPVIREVRGKGLFIGLELTEEARPFCEKLKTLGLLCKETHSHIIRFAPPLTIIKEELDWAYNRIAQVFDARNVQG